jgi:hypothetical protein
MPERDNQTAKPCQCSSLRRISAKAAAGLSLSTGNVDIPLGASAGEPPEGIVFTGP